MSPEDPAQDEEEATVAEPVAASRRPGASAGAEAHVESEAVEPIDEGATATGPMPALDAGASIGGSIAASVAAGSRPGASSSPSIAVSRSGVSGVSGVSGTRVGATTVASPLEALERDEILRTRWFCIVAFGMEMCGGSSLAFVPGDPVARYMLAAAVVLAAIGIGFLYRRTNDPIAFRKPSTAIGFFLPTVAVAAAIPYFGAFSPAACLVVLAVYFTGLGNSVRLAASVWALCAVSQGVTAGLVITGVTRDTGLVDGAWMPTHIQILVQLLVQMVMLGTYVTARLSRRSMLLAVGELERAIRVATQREALLLEARDELERALRSGRGRFSDQIISGYELGEVIGRGAMGEVYAATDPKTGDPVAIKLLSQASLSNQQHVQRFFRELKTASGVQSPHVVRVLEIGEYPVPFMVMELLEGESLSELLRGKRTLSPERIAELLDQIADGLTAAQAAGVVHRDIKPQNLFSHHGTWKILDFGVARLAEHGDTLTHGQLIGTPAYMAPEQARGANVDFRTDVYALAAVAYRALCGQPPFQARELADTLYRVVHTAPKRPSALSRLDPAFDLVLAIGLAKEPDQRFATARELSDAFAQALRGQLPAEIRARGEALVAAGAFA